MIRILNAKLSALARTINHLRVIIVSLGIYLLITHSFWESIILLLVYYFLLSIRKILPASLLKAFKILLSWCHNCFLWVSRADVIIIVSLCTCDSISCWTYSCLILIQKLKLLLLILILILDHHLLHFLSIFIERNLYSSIWITYIITLVIIQNHLLTIVTFLLNSISKIILLNLLKSTTMKLFCILLL